MSVDIKENSNPNKKSSQIDRNSLSEIPCVHKMYWRNGNLKYIGFVDNNIDKNKNGRGKYFDVSGNIYFVGNFRNNKFDGPNNTYFHTNMMIRFKGESRNGNFKKGVEFHKNGKFKVKGSYDKFQPSFDEFNIEYHPNGQLLKVGFVNKFKNDETTKTEPKFEGMELDIKGYRKGENPEDQANRERANRIIWMFNHIRNLRNAENNP